MAGIFKKKTFLFGLIAVLVIVLLAVGGGEEPETESEEEEEEIAYVSMPENPAKMTGETISVYNWGDYIWIVSETIMKEVAPAIHV